MGLRSVFVLAMTMSFGAVSAMEDSEVLQHCTKACAEKIRPQEPEMIEYLQAQQIRACQPLYAANPNLGHTCRTSFESVAETSCVLGCTLRQDGNPVKNNPKVASHRSRCDQYKSKNPYPALYNACKSGIHGGVDLYATLGKKARIEAETQLTQPEPEIISIKEETVIEVEGVNKADVEHVVEQIEEALEEQKGKREQASSENPKSKEVMHVVDATEQVKNFLQKSFFPSGLRKPFQHEN